MSAIAVESPTLNPARAPERPQRFLPISGILFGILLALALWLTSKEPGDTASAKQVFAYWSTHGGGKMWLSILGLELAAIVLIFTSQAWNMAFSFHQSLITIPTQLSEAARIYRLGFWQRFSRLELPFGAIALIANSMMSWAGGWFFLMASEQFTLGAKDLRLPGLGSYLAHAVYGYFQNGGGVCWATTHSAPAQLEGARGPLASLASRTARAWTAAPSRSAR